MNSRFIDPQTRDYIAENGGFRSHRGQMPTVLWLLLTPRGSCAVAPEAGNRFAEVDILVPESARRAEQFAFDALKPLIDTSRIWDVKIRISVEGSAIDGTISFKDSTGSQSERFGA